MGDKRRVVITGLGVATPLGLGIEPFWEALIKKQSGIRRIEMFDPSGLPSQIGGQLPDFTLGNYIPKSYRKSAKVLSRDIRIAVVNAYLAATDAGLATKCLIERGEAQAPSNIDSRRFGANIGAGLICADLKELTGALSTAADDNGNFSISKWGDEGMTNITPLWLLKYLPNMLACHVTIVHDAQAPSNTITCTEASSHLAIGEAFRTISRGNADVCFCGGAESKIHPLAITRPALWGQLITDCNDNPHDASRPFGAKRGGMVVAEGGGLIILEALDHALKRAARIYAEISGFGAAASTYSWSKPDPQGRGIALALRNALRDAQTSAENIDLVAPMGTGTIEHDAGEIAAWNDVFGDRLAEIHALSTRGAIGNNGAGSGAIDVAASVMAIHQNTVPPSVNTDALDSDCRFRFVQDDPIDAKVNCAVSAGYAMAGGQCAALVIRRYGES